MSKKASILLVIFVVFVAVLIAKFFFEDVYLSLVAWGQDVDYTISKVQEGSYENQRTVEDTARAEYASYKTYVARYELFSHSDSKYDKEQAMNALIMANNVALRYNNYITENKFMWVSNMPHDLPSKLDVIIP